jgi:hypothetical protein
MELAIKQNCEDKTFSLDVLKASATFKNWIVDEKRITMIHDINHDSSLDSATYIVVTKDVSSTRVKGQDKYTITRFFSIGHFENMTIHASQDHVGKTAAEVFALLMSKVYSRGTY